MSVSFDIKFIRRYQRQRVYHALLADFVAKRQHNKRKEDARVGRPKTS